MAKGMDGKIADAFNDVIEMNERMSAELERLSRARLDERCVRRRRRVGRRPQSRTARPGGRSAARTRMGLEGTTG